MKIAPLFTEDEITEKVRAIADSIRRDHAGSNPLLVGCLSGCFVFMADLVRALKIPLECDFMKLSSYEDRMTAGKLTLLLDNTLPVEGRDVIVVEDIVDTGASLSFIMERLRSKGAGSLKAAALLYKESPRAKLPKEAISYLGFIIPDLFVVGYGIDCAQRHRELPYIGAVRA